MSKFIFVILILSFILASFAMITGHQGFSLKIFVTGFWILLVGFLTYLFEIIHEK